MSSCVTICGELIAAKARVLVGDVSLLPASVAMVLFCVLPADMSVVVIAAEVAVCDVLTEDCPRVIVVPGKANVPGIWNPNDIVRPDPSALLPAADPAAD